VANIHFWHGLDRVIEGLREYYAAPHQCIVRLRIAGDGVETLQRLNTAALEAALQHAGRIDKLVKGIGQGNVWEEFLRLGLRLCRPAATRPA
jgi:hypothetical protein